MKGIMKILLQWEKKKKTTNAQHEATQLQKNKTVKSTQIGNRLGTAWGPYESRDHRLVNASCDQINEYWNSR
jgi:hypothetical protein